jgi:hypothetical protein
MAPRGAFAAIRPWLVKCEAGRARGGARARTFWSSGGLVRVVKRSPARSALAHPRRRARTPKGLFGRPRPKVGAAGGMARERRRVAPTHDRTIVGSARAIVRPPKALSRTTTARLRSNARAPQPGRRPLVPQAFARRLPGCV